MGLRSLQANMLRSLLATLGVIIGVGAVISANAVLEGAKKGLPRQFRVVGREYGVCLAQNGQTRRPDGRDGSNAQDQ